MIKVQIHGTTKFGYVPVKYKDFKIDKVPFLDEETGKSRILRKKQIREVYYQK
jgi:hypothetical protein